MTLAALLFVAPLPFRSPGRVVDDVSLWVKGMLLKYDEESIGQRPDRAYSFKNQSIQATVHRLVRPVLADGEADRVWRVNLLDLDFQSTTLVMLAATASLGLFYLVVHLSRIVSTDPRRRRRTGDGCHPHLGELVLDPFNYSYVWLLFPITVLIHLTATASAYLPPAPNPWSIDDPRLSRLDVAGDSDASHVSGVRQCLL